MIPPLRLTPRLALLFVGFGVVLLAGIGGLAYRSGRESLHRATVSEVLSTAIEKQAAVSAWIEERQTDVAVIAQGVAEELEPLVTRSPGDAATRAARERVAAELGRWTGEGAKYVSLFVMEPAGGQVVAATDPREVGKFKEDRAYFREGRLRPYTQNVMFSVALEAPAMTVAAPIRSADGRLLGVLAGRLDLGQLGAIMTRRAGLHATDDAYLVTPSRLFATQPRLLADPGVLRRGVHTEAVRRCLDGDSGVLTATDYRGVPSLVAYRWQAERALCLIVKVDEAEALAPALAFGQTLLGAGAVVLGLASILAVVMARGITGPIRALQTGAAWLRRGELGMRLPETRHDELGDLARAFNAAAAALAEQQAQLEAQAQELQVANRGLEEHTRSLQALLRASLVLTSSLDLGEILPKVVDLATRLVDGRSAILQLLAPDGRLEIAAAHGMSDEYLRRSSIAPSATPVVEAVLGDRRARTVEDMRARPDLPLQEAPLREGIVAMAALPVFLGETTLGVLTVHKATPYRFPDRELSALSVLADQTALAIEHARRLREAEEQAQRLAEKAHELEAFSYSVSHDLRAPIRAIDGFSRILLEEYDEALPAEARRYLRVVRDNTRQMGQLIDDLLAFSRLSRQALRLQPLAPTALVRQALEDLRAEQAGRRIELVLADLPRCHADPALLKQVWLNLLSNALKFTRRREVARIEVGAAEEDGQPVYFVRDNGVGFDMCYAGKLFGVFQRLHRAEDYEGTGVGLAIVHRVVQRHGGRAWAEGAVDGGATFYFTLRGDVSHG